MTYKFWGKHLVPLQFIAVLTWLLLFICFAGSTASGVGEVVKDDKVKVAAKVVGKGAEKAKEYIEKKERENQGSNGDDGDGDNNNNNG